MSIAMLLLLFELDYIKFELLYMFDFYMFQMIFYMNYMNQGVYTLSPVYINDI